MFDKGVMRKNKPLLLVLFFLLLLPGCSPFVDNDQITTNQGTVELSSQTLVSQSFVPRFAGLRGIQVKVSPLESGDGVISARMIDESQGLSINSDNTFRINDIQQGTVISFIFHPQPDLQYTRFQVEISVRGAGTVSLVTGEKDSYLDGILSVNSETTDTQLFFRLNYDKILLIKGLISEFFLTAIRLLGALALFVIPGWALLLVLWPRSEDFPFLERGAIAIGLSVALYPTIILWTSKLGLRLGPGYAWLPMGVASLAILWVNRRKLNRVWVQNALQKKNLPDSEARNRFHNVDLLVVFVMFLVILVRFWVIRGLAGPLWGDSYQHTMMATLIVQNGGLFDSWLPYVPLSSFTYHFGFHSAVAVFHWLSGMEVMDATLWVGQLMNCFAVFSLYALIKQLEPEKKWAGLVAILIAGLALIFPIFLVNWGRFTQLTGQVVLPTTLIFLIGLVRTEKFDWKLILLTALSLAGLALTHYRVLLLGALLIPVIFIFNLKKETFKVHFWALAASGVLAFLMFLPWFLHVFQGGYDEIVISQLSATTGQPILKTYFNAFSHYYPDWVWLTCLIATLYGVTKKKVSIILVLIWAVMLFLILNPAWVGLPGDGVIDDLSIYIIFYIPITGIISIFIADIIDLLDRKIGKTIEPVVVVIVVIFSLVGINNQRKTVDQHRYAYLTWPDRYAMRWIRESVPQESKILVNFEYSYGKSLISGIDSGWWIPYLASRGTNLPPLIFGSEQSFGGNYYAEVMELGAYITEESLTDPSVVQHFLELGYEYVFIGRHPLRSAYPFQAELETSDYYDLVYDVDGVKLLKLIHP